MSTNTTSALSDHDEFRIGVFTDITLALDEPQLSVHQRSNIRRDLLGLSQEGLARFFNQLTCSRIDDAAERLAEAIEAGR